MIRPGQRLKVPTMVPPDSHTAAVAGVTLLANQPAASAAATKDPHKWKGTKFRAYVRHDSTASIEELKLLEPGPRQIVVETKAFQACYTTTTPV